VNIQKTLVKVPSFPPYTPERVMATVSAWKSSKLRGAGEASARLEKLNRDVLIREGACEYAPRP